MAWIRGSPTLRSVRGFRSVYGRVRHRVSPSGRRARGVQSVLNDPSLAKYDLGGVGKGRDGWRTVNLVEGVDIHHDICDLDGICANGSVDVFLMRHTLEHLPLPVLHPFLDGVRRKLRLGGRLVVIQTDGRKVLAMYQRRRLDFYRDARRALLADGASRARYRGYGRIRPDGSSVHVGSAGPCSANCRYSGFRRRPRLTQERGHLTCRQRCRFRATSGFLGAASRTSAWLQSTSSLAAVLPRVIPRRILFRPTLSSRPIGCRASASFARKTFACQRRLSSLDNWSRPLAE